ncbi:MAG: hypothetical protein HY530_01090 [Chloroflexi bacterium]|nr:hypothetical protein [Chloroflexota bacterium]
MNTRIKIKPKTINLNNDDIQKLCNIINKAIGKDSNQSIKLRISGGNEEVSSNNIDDFVNAKWPTNVDEIHLSAACYKTGREIEFWFDNDLYGIQRIYVSGSDLDWVSARTKEIEDFINDHRNFHWVFNLPFIWVFWIFAFSFLMLFLILNLNLNITASMIMGSSTGTLLFFALSPIARIFPFINVETNRPSGRKSLRKFLTWLIPSLFIALIAGVILNITGLNE